MNTIIGHNFIKTNKKNKSINFNTEVHLHLLQLGILQFYTDQIFIFLLGRYLNNINILYTQNKIMLQSALFNNISTTKLPQFPFKTNLIFKIELLFFQQ